MATNVPDDTYGKNETITEMTYTVYRRKAGTSTWSKRARKKMSAPFASKSCTLFQDKDAAKYPNTKFQYKIVYELITYNTTYDEDWNSISETKTKTARLTSNIATVRTPPQNCYRGKYANGKVSWKKAKNGATGYIITYDLYEYRGMNNNRMKVYKVYHKYIIVNRNTCFVRLSGKIRNIYVDPYVKQGTQYCVYGYGGQCKTINALIRYMKKAEFIITGSEFVYS